MFMMMMMIIIIIIIIIIRQTLMMKPDISASLITDSRLGFYLRPLPGDRK